MAESRAMMFGEYHPSGWSSTTICHPILWHSQRYYVIFILFVNTIQWAKCSRMDSLVHPTLSIFETLNLLI